MTRKTVNTSLAPDCTLGIVQGDLRVKGWDLPQIAVDADLDQVDLQEEEDTLRLNCQGDCQIRVPYGTSLVIDAVHGDAQIKLLEEPVKIGEVHGSLSLRNVAGLSAGLVHGDLSASSLSGDLAIGQVMGDAQMRQVEGAVQMGLVQGDLDLNGIRGNIQAEVQGDINLRVAVLEGDAYQLSAQGDVVCSLPAQAKYRLHLVSRGRSITLRLPDHQQSYSQEKLDFEVGEAGVEFSITAGGSINLMGQEIGWEPSWGMGGPYMADYGEQIARQVESQIGQQIEEVSRRVKQQMDQLSETLAMTGFSPEDTQRIVDQAMKVSERETARAQEKMRRAQEKLERKLEEAQRKAEQKARATERSHWTRPRHTWGRSWVPHPSPPPPPAAASPQPASEEERLMILRMLEQKKISLEEAEKLLSALEGGE